MDTLIKPRVGPPPLKKQDRRGLDELADEYDDIDLSVYKAKTPKPLKFTLSTDMDDMDDGHDDIALFASSTTLQPKHGPQHAPFDTIRHPPSSSFSSTTPVEQQAKSTGISTPLRSNGTHQTITTTTPMHLNTSESMIKTKSNHLHHSLHDQEDKDEFAMETEHQPKSTITDLDLEHITFDDYVLPNTDPISTHVSHDSLEDQIELKEDSYCITIPCPAMFVKFLTSAISSMRGGGDDDSICFVLKRCAPKDYYKYLHDTPPKFLPAIPMDQYLSPDDRRTPPHTFWAYLPFTNGTKLPYAVPIGLKKLGLLMIGAKSCSSLFRYPVYILHDHVLSNPTQFYSITLPNNDFLSFVKSTTDYATSWQNAQNIRWKQFEINMMVDSDRCYLAFAAKLDNDDDDDDDGAADDGDRHNQRPHTLKSPLLPETKTISPVQTDDAAPKQIDNLEIMADNFERARPWVKLSMLASACNHIISASGCGSSKAGNSSHQSRDDKSIKDLFDLQMNYISLADRKRNRNAHEVDHQQNSSRSFIPDAVEICFTVRKVASGSELTTKFITELSDEGKKLLRGQPDVFLSKTFHWSLSLQQIRNTIQKLPDKSLLIWNIPQWISHNDYMEHEEKALIHIRVIEPLNPLPTLPPSNPTNERNETTDEPVMEIRERLIMSELRWDVFMMLAERVTDGNDNNILYDNSSNNAQKMRVQKIEQMLHSPRLLRDGTWDESQERRQRAKVIRRR